MPNTTATTAETSTARYRSSQRLLHWLMAIVIISALVIGLYCSYLTPGIPLRRALLDIHKSLGMTALFLIAIRLPLRLSLGEPAYQRPLGVFNHYAARGAHILLYILMILMPLAGYATSAAGGHDLPWFGLFQWPNLLSHDKGLERAAAEIHEYGAYCLYAIVSLHILAALWHHFVRKDEVLKRMSF
ncbi:cytochrome b561 [Rhizobium sp. ERR 922]|uniref:cytochrome b n=1 Tax=unclassified Rhizobium TaxID=2613769 RepID=UPI0011A3C166|nr:MULTISPECIES: cytochrome b [unclassified Rhizobium]TWB58277.1 cytochrome b561 [Rhizobium sp. ERR 922]TWB99972.1 cytochrome b561 [Rhizobium sp. ERR 942]